MCCLHLASTASRRSGRRRGGPVERMQRRGNGQSRESSKPASTPGNRASTPQGNSIRMTRPEGEGAGVSRSPEALAEGPWVGGGVGFWEFPACHMRARGQSHLWGNRALAQRCSWKVLRDRGGLWGNTGHLCQHSAGPKRGTVDVRLQPSKEVKACRVLGRSRNPTRNITGGLCKT